MLHDVILLEATLIVCFGISLLLFEAIFYLWIRMDDILRLAWDDYRDDLLARDNVLILNLTLTKFHAHLSLYKKIF